MIIITLVLVIILLLLIHQYNLHYGKKGRLLNRIPGPPTLPVLGNSLRSAVPNKKLLQTICKVQDQYYPIARAWICHMPFVLIRHPDDMKIILNNIQHIEKGDVYKVLQCGFGNGLLTSGGSKWHTRRKIITPAFHFHILKRFVDIFIKESNHMITTLKHTRKPVVKEILPLITNHTLNIICETALGISIKNSTEAQNVCHDVHQMCEIVTYRFHRIWLHNEWITSLLPIGKRQKKLLTRCKSFTQKIITERKQYHERTNGRYLKNIESDKFAQVNDTEDSENTNKRLALLDLLIAMSQENNLTDSDIMEEVNTFISTGYDTSTSAIYFALIMLAKHKDIQDRVRLEVTNMFKENGDKVTMSSLQNLSYLDRCIKETLRLYPSAPIIMRLTTEDVKLHSYTVPSGTNILLNIYAMHRDPKFWPNPELFDPDRFLPEKSKNYHPFSYLPFSAGPRNCIGQRFALLEIKATLAFLIHNFYLEPVDYFKDTDVKMKVTLCPTYPIRIRFVPIDTN
ncbi:cytochrome P450 4C1-like [Pseudomyrmex gracilis]|uniref:cytochrome P450 4C1-like n=1 Tax=Pseudomyrmex gracilis TaxID=219809 RepID=UPI000994E6EA|nr:cytochrome P450 4C1-like [Pseudomyrmex gracilis]